MQAAQGMHAVGQWALMHARPVDFVTLAAPYHSPAAWLVVAIGVGDASRGEFLGNDMGDVLDLWKVPAMPRIFCCGCRKTLKRPGEDPLEDIHFFRYDALAAWSYPTGGHWHSPPISCAWRRQVET